MLMVTVFAMGYIYIYIYIYIYEYTLYLNLKYILHIKLIMNIHEYNTLL